MRLFKLIWRFEISVYYYYYYYYYYQRSRSHGQKVQNIATRQPRGTVSLRCDAAQRDGAARPAWVMHSIECPASSWSILSPTPFQRIAWHVLKIKWNIRPWLISLVKSRCWYVFAVFNEHVVCLLGTNGGAIGALQAETEKCTAALPPSTEYCP